MSKEAKDQKKIKLTEKNMVNRRLLGIYIMRNKSSEPITTPFSDYAADMIVIKFRGMIKNLSGNSKPRWMPLLLIKKEQFYATTLEKGQWALFIRGKKKKSAGYLNCEVKKNQASYTYTYTHINDPHQKASDNDIREGERCVI